MRGTLLLLQFAERSYWDSRYVKDPLTFEWYRGYGSLQPILTRWEGREQNAKLLAEQTLDLVAQYQQLVFVSRQSFRYIIPDPLHYIPGSSLLSVQWVHGAFVCQIRS
jgi:hypothetical protein